MANTNVRGLVGFNKADGSINKLLAAYENDIVNVDTGLGYGLNLDTTTDVEFEKFADRVFMENYSNSPKTFNGTVWSNEFTNNMMTSKFIKKYRSRLFLGYCKFNGSQLPLDLKGNSITFPSRVFYSDLYNGFGLTWGLSWGTNGSTIGGTGIFQLTGNPTQNFKDANIKIGDPLFITNGDASVARAKPYIVSSVDSPYRLIVTETFPTTVSSLHYWVGSNWYDVGLDDGDYLTGFGDNDDKLLNFKNFSLYRYNGTSLQKVKNDPGTTYGRSVINIGSYTIYFHGSNTNTRKTGFYAYNGNSSILISRAIQPYIDNILTTNYSGVVSWREGRKYRAWTGKLTDTSINLNITKSVMTWDTEGGQWSIDSIADRVESATTYLESGTEKWFIGADISEVHETASGNGSNNTAMSFAMETGPYFPSTSNVANKYTRVQVVSENAQGLQVLYKLYGKPMDDDDQWQSLGEIQHNFQEFMIPQGNNFGRGFNLRFQERSTRTNTLQIKKFTMFYIPQSTSIYGVYG